MQVAKYADSATMGCIKLQSVARIPVYSGHCVEGTPVYSGHCVEGTPVYSDHCVEGTPVYSGHCVEGTPVYSGHCVEGTPVYSGHCVEGIECCGCSPVCCAVRMSYSLIRLTGSPMICQKTWTSMCSCELA